MQLVLDGDAWANADWHATPYPGTTPSRTPSHAPPRPPPPSSFLCHCPGAHQTFNDELYLKSIFSDFGPVTSACVTKGPQVGTTAGQQGGAAQGIWAGRWC